MLLLYLLIYVIFTVCVESWSLVVYEFNEPKRYKLGRLGVSVESIYWDGKYNLLSYDTFGSPYHKRALILFNLCLFIYESESKEQPNLKTDDTEKPKEKAYKMAV